MTSFTIQKIYPATEGDCDPRTIVAHTCVVISFYGNRKQVWVQLTIRILQLRGLEKECNGKGSNINNAAC